MKIGFEAKRIFHNKTGLGNYSRDLIRNLHNYFPENEYYLYNPKPSNNKKFEHNLKNVFEKLPSRNLYKKFRNLWRQYFVTNDLIKDEIKIYHGLSGEIPFGLKSKNIKSVVTIHDLIFMKMPHLYSYFDRKIHFYKFKKAANHANLIVAISQQTKDDIVNYFKINPDKIKIIYQGCNIAFKKIYSDSEKQNIRTKYNLPDNFILNVGTIEPRKNALLIVQAIRNIDTVLVIIGKETNYSDQIKKYISDNNMQHKVIFLKNLTIEELAIVYQMSQIFIYPSFYEGFGIPIIEALYSKIPVITSIGGVFPEAGGPNSVYINPESAVDLENEIVRLLGDENLRSEIAEKGFDFAQNFNDDNIANQYMDIYKSLVG